MKRRAQSEVMQAAIGLIVLAGLLLVAINAFGGSDRRGNTPEQTDITNLLETLDETATHSELFVQPSLDEYIMFFSTGIENIILQDKRGRSHFVFARPEDEACSGTSCVCVCGGVSNFRPTQTELGVTLSAISPTNDINENAFICDAPLTLSCSPTQQQLIFTNSRGEQAYANQVITLAERLNDGTFRPEYVPVPLDIVTIVGNADNQQSPLYNFAQNNLFFEREAHAELDDIFDGIQDLALIEQFTTRNRYDKFEQEEEILTALLTEYSWRGGFVLGGSGFADSERDVDTRRFQSPQYHLRLNKTGNIMAICPYQTCLFGEGVTNAKNTEQRLTQQRRYLELVDEIKLYFENDINTCLQENTGDTRSSCVLIAQLGVIDELLRYEETIRSGDEPNYVVSLTIKDSLEEQVEGPQEAPSILPLNVSDVDDGVYMTISIYDVELAQNLVDPTNIRTPFTDFRIENVPSTQRSAIIKQRAEYNGVAYVVVEGATGGYAMDLETQNNELILVLDYYNITSTVSQ